MQQFNNLCQVWFLLQRNMPMSNQPVQSNRGTCYLKVLGGNINRHIQESGWLLEHEYDMIYPPLKLWCWQCPRQGWARNHWLRHHYSQAGNFPATPDRKQILCWERVLALLCRRRRRSRPRLPWTPRPPARSPPPSPLSPLFLQLSFRLQGRHRPDCPKDLEKQAWKFGLDPLGWVGLERFELLNEFGSDLVLKLKDWMSDPVSQGVHLMPDRNLRSDRGTSALFVCLYVFFANKYLYFFYQL